MGIGDQNVNFPNDLTLVKGLDLIKVYLMMMVVVVSNNYRYRELGTVLIVLVWSLMNEGVRRVFDIREQM